MTLDNFFKPKAIAVVGASRDGEKPGRVIFRNLIGWFKGKVYPVNPSVDEVDNHKCYPSVSKIPTKVDLAMIAVPAAVVPSVLEDCGKAGVKAVVVIAGGFGEVGNHELDEAVKKILQKYKIRLIGPNCLGIYDGFSRINAFFLPSYRIAHPKEGKITFLTQSGAIAGTGLDWAAGEGLGISKVVSYGNMLDVDEVDLLEYLKDDKSTQVIMLYVEGIKRGREFVRVAREVSRKKPIIVFKAGKSSSGAKAAASHTGSLAGSREIYDAAFKEAGVVQAYSLEEMFNLAKAFSLQPPAGGPRVAIITGGGGFGVMATDAVEANGLVMAQMDEKNIADLKARIPPYCSVKNPIDVTGDADNMRHVIALRAALADKNVDAAVLILLFQLPRLNTDIVPLVGAVIESTHKPVVGVAIGSEFTDVHRRLLEEVSLPVYSGPEAAIKVLKALAEYGKLKSRA